MDRKMLTTTTDHTHTNTNIYIHDFFKVIEKKIKELELVIEKHKNTRTQEIDKGVIEVERTIQIIRNIQEVFLTEGLKYSNYSKYIQAYKRLGSIKITKKITPRTIQYVDTIAEQLLDTIKKFTKGDTETEGMYYIGITQSSLTENIYLKIVRKCKIPIIIKIIAGSRLFYRLGYTSLNHKDLIAGLKTIEKEKKVTNTRPAQTRIDQEVYKKHIENFDAIFEKYIQKKKHDIEFTRFSEKRMSTKPEDILRIFFENLCYAYILDIVLSDEQNFDVHIANIDEDTKGHYDVYIYNKKTETRVKIDFTKLDPSSSKYLEKKDKEKSRKVSVVNINEHTDEFKKITNLIKKIIIGKTSTGEKTIDIKSYIRETNLGKYILEEIRHFLPPQQ